MFFSCRVSKCCSVRCGGEEQDQCFIPVRVATRDIRRGAESAADGEEDAMQVEVAALTKCSVRTPGQQPL